MKIQNSATSFASVEFQHDACILHRLNRSSETLSFNVRYLNLKITGVKSKEGIKHVDARLYNFSTCSK